MAAGMPNLSEKLPLMSRDMITGIQQGAKDAVGRMENGVAQVEAGSVLADDAGRAIGRIHDETREVIDVVVGISGAIGEQNEASRNIAQGVEHIAQMAEANHAAAQGTAHSAQSLRDLAASLEQALSRFRVA